MSELNYAELQVGEEIPAYTAPSISRTTLALFAGASGDHNPIHIDIDFARKAGMDDVFAQGMLIMAFLGRLLTNWVPQTAIRQFGVRFVSITNLRDKITCSGKVIDKMEKDGEKLVTLELTAANEDGDVKLSGQAVVALQQVNSSISGKNRNGKNGKQGCSDHRFRSRHRPCCCSETGF